MKRKLLVLIFVLLMTAALTISASAESEFGKNPWTDPASKIYVFEDYSTQSGDFASQPGYWSFAAAIGESPAPGSVKNGTLCMDVDTQAMSIMDAFFFNVHETVSPEIFSAAEGIGFYVKNDTLMDISAAPYGTGSGQDLLLMLKDAPDECDAITVDVNGEMEWADCYSVAAHVCIPSGFEGYVLIPMKDMGNGRSDYSAVVGKEFSLETIGVRLWGLMIYPEESFVVDNFFFYGENVPENVGDVVVTAAEAPTQTPTEAPTQEPAETPTETPTEAPTATAPATPQSGSFPWLIVAIAAAAAVVIAVIVLLVVKGKKKAK